MLLKKQLPSKSKKMEMLRKMGMSPKRKAKSNLLKTERIPKVKKNKKTKILMGRKVRKSQPQKKTKKKTLMMFKWRVVTTQLPKVMKENKR